jgi:hypothetical protein
MLFAYLSDSDSVNVTSVYERYPHRLAGHGFEAGNVNVASLLLMHPDLDVRRLLGRCDTLKPITELVTRVRQGSRDFRSIPNLLYKAGGEVQATGFTHKPASRYNDGHNDWSYYRETPGAGLSVSKFHHTLPNTGVCTWLRLVRRVTVRLLQHHACPQTLIQKDNDLVVEELRTMREAAICTSIRASVLFGEHGALAPVSGRRKGVRVQHPPLPAHRPGRAVAVLFTKAYGRVLVPGLASLDPHLPGHLAKRTRVEGPYERTRSPHRSRAGRRVN